MEKPLKRALSYVEQVKHLKDAHCLEVSDTERAIQILSSNNYYRLSGYAIGLYRQGTEIFLPGTRIEDIYALYVFDMRFRHVVFAAVEELETALRAQIAYVLAMAYGPDGYMNTENFTGKENSRGEKLHEKFRVSFEKEVAYQGKSPVVKHHKEKYGGKFPIWVAVELFTFRTLSTLYSAMQPKDRRAVAQYYETGPIYLESWIISLVEIRNLCAHYSRIYNRPLTKTPRLYPDNREHVSDRVFPILLTMGRMMRYTEAWQKTVDQITELIEEFQIVNLRFIGFPENWENPLRGVSIKK